jgi:serine/threonine protein kinase
MPATDKLRAALADRYVIEREIGAGGMATVYLARDIKHDREVALKVLRSDLSAVIGTERFLSEVRITARLDHPHILTLIDSGEADGVLFYVLPYVRGESLRAKLDREKQLSVDEAVSITKQVASALDYAHSHGVVHRDIKPENILIHEGEAVLADFGIALAVKEAGGNRLTETGLSLGTPQYMSPEQATGDRQLDRRSDIYSLAAVFYEMLGGEPPVTGGTAQAMVAKLLTEKPVKLRVLRDTVPVEIEAATEKALSKVPADRFTSAGDFARALSATPVRHEEKNSAKRIVAVIAGIAAIAVAVAVSVKTFKDDNPQATVTLRDKQQLTRSGSIVMGTMSDDAKMIAYGVNVCSVNGCRYGIDIKDLASGESRRLIDNLTALYRLDLSPDRRNLLILGSINGVFGSWVVSLVGATPRIAVPGGASAFYADGDSLVMIRSQGPSDHYWVLFAGTDAQPVDSVRVNEPADRAPAPFTMPQSRYFGLVIDRGQATRFAILDRAGHTVSKLDFPSGSAGTATTDALWIYDTPRTTGNVNLVRVPFDRRTMKLASRGDTVYSGTTNSMSLSADGSMLLYDDGATDYSSWALPFEDMVSNKFSDEQRLMRATGEMRGSISPDGVITTVGTENPQGGIDWVVYRAGSSTPVPIPGRHRSAVPLDSTTIKLGDITDSTTTMSLYNYKTRRTSAVRTVKSRRLEDFTRVGNAWAWIPNDGTRIMVQADDAAFPRRINPPKWYKTVWWVSGTKDGTKIAFLGWQAPNEDSLGVGVLSLPEGKFTQVLSTFAEGGGTSWTSDGGLIAMLNDTPEAESFYLLREGQPPRKLGSTPRLIRRNLAVGVTADMKRAFIVTKDDRRDIFMSRVIR